MAPERLPARERQVARPVEGAEDEVAVGVAPPEVVQPEVLAVRVRAEWAAVDVRVLRQLRLLGEEGFQRVMD